MNEEEIKIIKDFIYLDNGKRVNYIDLDNMCGINDIGDCDKFINAIEIILKENEELKAKLEFKQFGDLDNPEFEKYISEYKKTDYIPKSKIEDKIKECEFNFNRFKELGENRTALLYYRKIKSYQELLEEE